MSRLPTLASTLSHIAQEATRTLLPSWCVVCECELPWRARIASCCDACWALLPALRGAKCLSCALPLAGDADDTLRCIDCSARPEVLDWCDAWGRYGGGLDRVLHAFKFDKHDFLDAPLASLLDSLLLARGDTKFDAIVPVPMSRAKERRRGYNQAELLARALARRAGIGCSLLLEKREERETQSTLDRARRAENVHGAFAASADAKGQSILIVDDICTTGETLRACATELRRAGAVRVAAVAVAKAV